MISPDKGVFRITRKTVPKSGLEAEKDVEKKKGFFQEVLDELVKRFPVGRHDFMKVNEHFQISETTCFFASAIAAGENFLKKHNKLSNIDQEALMKKASEYGFLAENGTPNTNTHEDRHNIKKFLSEQLGIIVIEHLNAGEASDKRYAKALIRAIQNKRPFILNEFGEKLGHWILVYGIEKTKKDLSLLVMDPIVGFTTISRDELLSLLIPGGNAMRKPVGAAEIIFIETTY